MQLADGGAAIRILMAIFTSHRDSFSRPKIAWGALGFLRNKPTRNERTAVTARCDIVS